MPPKRLAKPAPRSLLPAVRRKQSAKKIPANTPSTASDTNTKSRCQDPDDNIGGWRPPKVKRTSKERSIGFIGAVVPAGLKPDFDKSFARQRKVLNGGPNGCPVYDNLRYKIDYQRVKKSERRPRRTPKSYLAMMDAETKKSNRIREIMQGVTRVDLR